MGIVTLEAMTCELPVIVSERAGSSELVKKHNCGITINPSSQNEIYNAILKLSENEKLRQIYGKRGTLAVKKYYTQDTMIRRLKKLYEGVLKTT